MSMKTDEFIARLGMASPGQLIIINYELIIGFMEHALDGNDRDSVKKPLLRARDLMRELAGALKQESELYKTLMPVYIYINGMINRGILYLKPEENRKELREGVHMLRSLLEAWIEAEKSVGPGKDYVGFTYDRRGNLMDFADVNADRGYKA